MNERLTRRDFVATAGMGALAGPSLVALAQTPQIVSKTSAKPVVVSSANGNKWKDADGLTCVAKAFKPMTAGEMAEIEKLTAHYAAEASFFKKGAAGFGGGGAAGAPHLNE